MYQGILDTIDDGEKSANNIGRQVILPPSFIGGHRDMKKRHLNALALVQRFGKPDLFVTMTSDRPDVIARVFRSKLIALKKQITEEHVFGKVAAIVYVVEFQKRGLPHAHFLIILDHGYKLTRPSDYDNFFSAEILSTESPQLREIILKRMMHGPCGSLNPKCGCMKKRVKDDLVCKYNFPKSYVEETTTNEDDFPLYRRRNTREHVRIRGANLDNRWGQNRVSFNFDGEGSEGVDEIKNFQAGRWVSPCEAAWRIFGFDLFEMTPFVILLPVHLPNMQIVYMRSREQLESVVGNEKRSKAALTEFFTKNASLPGGKGLRYTEMIAAYRWDSSNKEWVKRTYKKNNVSRMAIVVPSEGERFYLRLFLGKVINPILFNHLKTVDGVLYSTFQEAAIKHGLLQEDSATTSCVKEASEAQMPSAMRQLFATLLIFFQPSNPNVLWLRVYSSLSEDFKHKYPNCPSKVKKLTVKELESSLEAMGMSLEYFELGHLVDEADDGIRATRDIVDALEAPIPLECLDCRDKLNATQEKKVLPTVTSGIAASNISFGRTTHSRFKIPLDSKTSLTCDVPKQGSLAALIKEVVLFIWDEASMIFACYPDNPFGGKVIVFGGDFRQVLPIFPRRTQKEVVGVSVVSSYKWPILTKFQLTENIRAKEDPLYSAFLLALGNGQLHSVENSYVQLPQHIVNYYDVNDDPVPINIFNERAIFTPVNEDVDAINEYMIGMFPGTSTMYASYDSILDDIVMKHQYVPLDKLTPKTKKYKIKVKGNNIRGTLFDDEIENFEGILEHEKEYVIADAPIRNTNPMYRHKEGDYYLSFRGSTAIQPLNPNTGPVLPNYIPIVEVPPTSTADDRFDILGVVVYLEDTRRKKKNSGYEFDVLGDRLIISLYGELATKDCAKLTAWYVGFSLALSMSTVIDTNPTGPEVDALKAW
ncbi:uncharacterized protein LOC110710049 [Chenopodium quinoa]|uniref:uncharacterized protein LOC110710049 n=1 Tax=Chenopodium quinoa TaxID=63459 RepID=UPI000B789AC5|nr:uncharacterized protein LOC110710049 [Chenopodium quinoa]